MWRVKKLSLSLSPSPQSVSGRASETERARSGLRSGGRRQRRGSGKAGSSLGTGMCVESSRSCSFRAIGGQLLYCPRNFLEKEEGRTDPAQAFSHSLLSQGKPAMRTPLRELPLQPGALSSPGKGASVGYSPTSSPCKLGLQVSFDWAHCRGRRLRGTEGQGWNVINNDNEVFYLSDIHLQLFRPTERCPRVIKGNPLRTRTSIWLLVFIPSSPR